MTSPPAILELARQSESESESESESKSKRWFLSDGTPQDQSPRDAAIAEEVLSLPETFALGSLRDGRLRLVEPIEVAQMEEGGKCVVEAMGINEFGFGDNPSEAIKDLQAAIAELFLTLDAEQERLGPDLASVWTVLSQKVCKADAINRP